MQVRDAHVFFRLIGTMIHRLFACNGGAGLNKSVPRRLRTSRVLTRHPKERRSCASGHWLSRRHKTRSSRVLWPLPLAIAYLVRYVSGSGQNWQNTKRLDRRPLPRTFNENSRSSCLPFWSGQPGQLYTIYNFPNSRMSLSRLTGIGDKKG